MKLPPARREGTVSVEQAIERRRTVRSFTQKPLTLDQLSRMLRAAQGITGKSGFKRSAPSAGALYPMDLYVAAGGDSVEKLEAGVYHYNPQKHALTKIAGTDLREETARACLSQMWVSAAPVNFVITAEYERIRGKYGNRGDRYAMIEAGHIGQNLFLQAQAEGLAAGIVGAFHDEELNRVLQLPRSHEPLLVMPAGYQ